MTIKAAAAAAGLQVLYSSRASSHASTIQIHSANYKYSIHAEAHVIFLLSCAFHHNHHRGDDTCRARALGGHRASDDSNFFIVAITRVMKSVSAL